MNALEKLKVAKFKADKSQVDRDNYAAFSADRIGRSKPVTCFLVMRFTLAPP